MIESDTIKLLRECDAGIKMGTASIRDVEDHIKNPEMKEYLLAAKDEHEELGREMETLLDKYRDDGKEPNPIAKGMSYMKTNMKLMMEDTDSTIADLMIDGCNMGVKSLNRYLNEYKAADEVSKDMAKRLINLEEKMSVELRKYL